MPKSQKGIEEAILYHLECAAYWAMDARLWNLAVLLHPKGWMGLTCDDMMAKMGESIDNAEQHSRSISMLESALIA